MPIGSRSSSPVSYASSPFNTVDSSPPTSRPSSPDIDALPGSDDTEWQHTTRTGHPFAASAKADRPPRQYAKREASPRAEAHQDEDVHSSKRRRVSSISSRFTDDSGFYEQRLSQEGPSSSQNSSSYEKTESEIWSDAIDAVLNEAAGPLDLSERGLTYIPDSVRDLKNFFTLGGASSGLFSRASSKARIGFSREHSFTPGLPTSQLRLFLSGNHLSRLPRSLFLLHNMVHLDLRNNNLTYIPPEISNLHSLQSFNISQNQVTFLPAEILQMELQNLLIIPNPLLPCPETTSRTMTRSLSSKELPSRRAVGLTEPRNPHASRIPALFELCLRMIIREGLLSSTDRSIKQVDYPIHVRELFETLVDGFKDQYPSRDTAVPSPSPGDSETLWKENICGLGNCPSPLHAQESERNFVYYQETRITWEAVVAGQSVGTLVPVRWRGCSRGCLDFLTPSTKVGQELLPRPEEVLEEEEEEVGQVLTFAAQTDGFDEFD